VSNKQLKKKLSQWLHSLAKELEKEEEPKNPRVSPRRARRRRRTAVMEEERPPQRSLAPKTPVFLTLTNILSGGWRGFQKLSNHPKVWLWLGLGTGIGTGAIATALVFGELQKGLPKSVEDLLAFAPPETMTIKAANGEVLQQVGLVSHDRLKIWQVPDPVLQAFIASEDRRFATHRGVDPQGVLRAVFSNLRAGGVVEGGSTITQQLARITYLSQERSITRKLKEMLLAHKIEGNFSKTEILEQYLNLVYLGSGAYGLGDAAWVYFGKPVEQLTLGEAATLAGIVPAPSVYSPIENPERAKERRNLVLQTMVDAGYLTPEAAKAAKDTPLVTNPQPLKRLQVKAPYFTQYIRAELLKHLKPEQLKEGGLIVETTLNPRWQESAEATMERLIRTYGRWERFKQGAMVAIDPRNGQIKAMVGGTDFQTNQFNRVTQAQRQPGSTFKTFVYATAIAAGFSPNQGFLDAEYVVDGYKPENFGDKYSGNFVSMRQALTSSLNVVAVKTLVDVGWNPIMKLAKSMGIESPLNPTYSLALGASEVNLLELTGAYGTLANQGVHQQVYGLSRVLNRHGEVIYQAPATTTTALDADTAAIMTWMLSGVVNDGTGRAAQIGRPVAGKTGTSDKARDLWFVGYIPQLVTGVWLGNDDNRPTWGASTSAAVAWRWFMLDAIKDISYQPFAPTPRQLDGRKATIKKEPIRPKRSYYKPVQPTGEENNNTQVTTTEEERPRRRKRRMKRRQSQEQTTQTTDTPPVASRSRRRAEVVQSPSSTPIPVTTAESSSSVSIPVTPASEIAPPAPPAARKVD
jgi:penicillin-binding protein 1A